MKVVLLSYLFSTVVGVMILASLWYAMALYLGKR